MWLHDKPLIKCIHFVREDDLNLKVADVLASDGTWLLQKLKMQLSTEVIHDTYYVPVGFDRRSEDKLIWNYSNTGDFTVKSTYNFLTVPVNPPDENWTWIWKAKGPEKIKTLLWLACWGRKMYTQS